MMRNKALLLLSTLGLLSACSPGVDVSSHPKESGESSTSQITSSEAKTSSNSTSSEDSSITNSSADLSSDSEGSSASSELSVDSGGNVSSEATSSEAPATKYRLYCSFQSGIQLKDGTTIKSSYLEGEEVAFTIAYDESMYLTPVVKLNGEVINPVEEGGKDYRFTMPGQESYLTIEAEEVVKKFAIHTDEIDDSIVRLDYMGENFNASSVLPGEEVKFALTLLNANYEIISVSATYLDEDEINQELDLTFENGIYSFQMPANAVSIHVNTSQLYSIVYHGSGNGYAISYLEGSSSKMVASKMVKFKLTNRDPSYSFNYVLAYSNANVNDGVWVGSGTSYRVEDEGEGIYSFVMPNNDVHIIVNSTKNYAITTSLDSGVDSLTLKNKQNYYKYNTEISFTLAFKEGFKAKKVEIVSGTGDEQTSTVIAPNDEGLYTFLIKADTTIKVSSQSAEVSSFWTERTMYYYQGQTMSSKNPAAEEIIINPDKNTIDYVVYQYYDTEEGGWELRRPIRRVAYGSGNVPYWHTPDIGWVAMPSYQGTNIPYEFDESTMKLTFSIGSRTYNLSFDSTASTFTIDEDILNEFKTTGKDTNGKDIIFQKWVG